MSKNGATYTLAMQYDQLYNPSHKTLNISQTGMQGEGTIYSGYDLTYAMAGNHQQIANIVNTSYRDTQEWSTPPPTHTMVTSTKTYTYDSNGNMLTYNTTGTDATGNVNRRMLWDEENHLLAQSDNGYVSTYWYDGAGERTVKQSGDALSMAVNGTLSGASTGTTNFTAYVNPYTVINNGNQMSKHIYVGTQRIVSKLCDAGAMADPTAATKATYTGSTLKYADKYTTLTNTVKARYDSLGVAYNGVDNKGATFYKASSSTPSGAGGSYYYHSDQLGSANYITDETGSVSQHLEYIPYGETFVDERYSTWHSPYKFNGKERDEETGLTYYSQRYFDGNVWYTVDPLAHKYPNVGSYVYCLGNPVKYVDPDGRQFITPLLGLADVLMSNKPVVTETMVRVGRATTETSSTGGKGINVERINAGRQAETEQLQKLGLEKNTESFTRVDPKTGKDVTTVPDGFKGGQTTEIKNLGQGQKQSLTEQLRAQKELSNENGTKPRLHINKEAGLTKPLQNAGFDITKYSIVPPAPSNKTQTQTNKPVWILFDKKH